MSGSTGPISFVNYPVNNRVPGVYAEIDGSQANTATVNQKTLVVGQKTAAGTGVPNVAVYSAGVGAAKVLGGPGSMLATALEDYRAIDGFGEVWLLPIQDDPNAKAGQSTLTPVGSPTAPGVIYLLAASTLVNIPVSTGDTVAAIVGRTVALVNALVDLPCTAAANAGNTAVVFTAKNAGVDAADIDLRLNYSGTAAGQVLPPGLTVTIQLNTVAGTINPSVAAALAGLGDNDFDFIVWPYTDAVSLNALDAFLDEFTGRWSPLSEIFGVGFYAYRGPIGSRTLFGGSRNGKHVVPLGFYDGPNPAWAWCAATVAGAAVRSRNDPALPLQDIALPNILPPPATSRDTNSELNSCYFDGISGFKVVGGIVFTDRLVTAYQVDGSGAPDNSYLNPEALFTLMAGIRDIRAFLKARYSVMKLVADGTPIVGGSRTCTSQTVLADAVGRYRVLVDDKAWMQDYAGFKRDARGRNAGGGQVQLLLPFRLANQLRDVAMLVQFTQP